MRNLPKPFWPLLILTVVLWVGVGIYYFSTKTTEVSKETTSQPSPTEIFSTPTPVCPPDVPPDTKMIEGIIGQLESGELVITSNGQDLHFSLGEDRFLRFADASKGVVVGAKLKVYYQEENGTLKFISAMVLK